MAGLTRLGPDQEGLVPALRTTRGGEQARGGIDVAPHDVVRNREGGGRLATRRRRADEIRPDGECPLRPGEPDRLVIVPTHPYPSDHGTREADQPRVARVVPG